MWPKCLKFKCNCLLLFIIIVANGRAQSYDNYNYNARPQLYHYQQPQMPAVQYIFSSPTAPPAHAPTNSFIDLNSRQSYHSTDQIVDGSERFTFEMIKVSESQMKKKNELKTFTVQTIFILF